MTSLVKLTRAVGNCGKGEQRFLCVIFFLLAFNLYFFFLFTIYFGDTDTPDFENYTASHLRPSSVISQNGSPPHSSSNSMSEVNSSLPNFSLDETEFIFSAIIERSRKKPEQLFLTFFALNRLLLSKGRSKWGPNRIKRESQGMWNSAEAKAKRIYYSENGTRDSFSNINCKMSNSVESDSYISEGILVPNALSIDSSFNGVIDVFRCELQATVGFEDFISSRQFLQVELFRSLRHTKINSLLNFSVPWLTRRAGYMQPPAWSRVDLTPLQEKSEMSFHRSYIPSSDGLLKWESLSFSMWNPWHVYNSSSHHPVYICLCGKTASPFVDDIALLLEFVQHNVLLGVRHIFLSVNKMVFIMLVNI